MAYVDSPEDAAFRAEVRAWLEANAEPRRPTGNWSDASADPSEVAEAAHFERCRRWQRTKYDGGFAAITWPERFGGRGGTVVQQMIYAEEEARFDVTNGFLGASIALVGPALMSHGSPEQCELYIPRLLSGEDVWCQLFSEPEAGSDLARLGTRAEIDGDELVVNGQKVWTSSAQYADYGILLARTDPDAPKHAGISFILLPMRVPGIEVRPLVTMARNRHFNEVFLSDVRVPLANVVGELNQGWAVARTTLANESVMIGSGAGRGDGSAALIEIARERGCLDDPRLRQELARAWIHEHVLECFRDRMTEDVREGRRPELDGSVMKVFWSESRIHRADLGVELQGPDGMLDLADADREGFWQNAMLSMGVGSIGGGTHEVHRNGIGERVLGLPREDRPDRAMSFRELKAHDAAVSGKG